MATATNATSDLDIGLTVAAQVCLFFLVLGFAGTVHVEDFKAKFEDRKGIIVGLSLQFLFMPLLGFAVASIYDIRPEEEVILIIMMSSPGGSYSNLLCAFFNADLALSVAMTTASTLAGVVMLPLNTLVYVELALQTDVQVDWVGLGTAIAIVTLGVIGGLYLGSRYPHRHDHLNALGQFFGLANIVLSLAASGANSEEQLWEKDIQLYAAVATPGIIAVLFTIFVGYYANLTKPEIVTCSIEVAFQNTGIALAMSFASFELERAALAAAVPILYGAFEAVLLVTYGFIVWKLGWTLAPANENVIKMLLGNYQDNLKEIEEKERTEIRESIRMTGRRSLFRNQITPAVSTESVKPDEEESPPI